MKNKKENQSDKIVLTGVTPSGDAMHIGNYFGAMLPLVKLAQSGHKVYAFVSDLHALTTIQDKTTLHHNIQQVVLNYLAFGIADTPNVIFFRQSQVPAHSELSVILSNFISCGQMQRMHAYKDKLQKGCGQQSINLGLFDYPILMAADILLYNSDLIPVGEDQKQHVELARDVAENFNHAVGEEILKLPEALISQETARIVGTDGERKMSKSLGNIIGIFDDEKVLEKQIMSSYTDSTRKKATDPGHVEGNPVFVYHDLFNQDKAEVEDLKKRYLAGEVGDVEVKQKLLLAHHQFFAQIRVRKTEFENNPQLVTDILERGRVEAETVANKTLNRVKTSLGLN